MADQWTIEAPTAPKATPAKTGDTWSVEGPSGVQPTQERGFLEKTGDLLRRAQVEGIGGAIAYPALRAQGWSPEQIKQVYDDFIAEMDAKDRADYAANPDETRFHQFITGKWVPHLFSAIGGQPEYLLGGGGTGVASRLAHAAGSAEAVDAVTQGIQTAEGLRDGIDWKRLNDTGAMTAVLGLPLEGLSALRNKVFPKANPGIRTPEEQAAHDAAVDAAVKSNPDLTVEELKALGVQNAEQVHAALQARQPVGKAGPIVETGRPGTVANNLDRIMQPKDIPVHQPNTKATAPTNVANDAEHTVVDDPNTPALEVGVTDEAQPKPLTPPDPDAFVEPQVSQSGRLVHEVTSDTPKNKTVYAHFTAEEGKEPLTLGVLINKETGEATINVETDKIDNSPDFQMAHGTQAMKKGLEDIIQEYPEITAIDGVRKRGAKGLKDTNVKIPAAVVTRIRNKLVAAKERDAWINGVKEAGLKDEAYLSATPPGETRIIKVGAAHIGPDASYHEARYITADGREIRAFYNYEGGKTKIEDLDIASDGGPNSIGPRDVRAMLKAIRKNHPEATSVQFERISGARKQSGAEPNVEMAIPPEPTVQAGQGFDLNGDAVYKPAPEIPEGEMPKYAKSINLEKLDTAKDVDEYILEQSKAIPRDYQSHQETEDLAAILGQDTAALLKKNPQLSELPQYAVALHNTLVEASNNVVSLAKKVKAGDNSDEALDELFKAVLVQRHIQERATKVSGTAGRTLEAHKIIKSGGASYAKALADLPHSKINSREGLEELAGVLADAPDAAAISKIIADTQKKTLWDKIIGFRYNMMLFGPTTHTANNIGIFSTVTHDLLNQSLAATTGQVTRSADRVAAREVASRVEGMMAGLFSGAAWRNARKALNEGDILTPTGKSEHTVQNEGNVGDLVALGSRALNAEDEFWRTIIHSGSNYALAYRTALKEGRKGEAFKARVQGLINSPTPEIVAASDEYAHRMLLRDTPTAPTAAFMRGRVIKPTDHLSIKALKGASQIVFPFVRVLDRATMYSIRHSPLSFLDRVTQADFKAGGARAEIAKARIATGTALATWAALKAFNGELTGPGPEDFEANQKWQSAGHRPNSIVVNGEYRDISNLLPLSIPLTTIAAAVEDAKTGKFSEKTYQEKIESLVGDVISGLGTNTWTSSIADLGKMVTGSQGQKDAARKGYAANVAASFVPAFLRQFNQANPAGLGDPSVRMTSGDGSLSQRVVGRVASAVPGVSTDLPEKYNVYGKPVMREGVVGPDFISNVKVSSLDPDPAVREMDRLMAANDYKGGVTPVESSLQVPDSVELPPELDSRTTAGSNDRRRLKLNAREVSEYQHLAGTYITDYVREQMKTPEWKRMSDAERLADIADTTEKAKSQARDELFWNPHAEFTVEAPAAGSNSVSKDVAADLTQQFGVRVTDSGIRSEATQRRYYNTTKGAAKPGRSPHEFDDAVDIAPMKGVSPAAIKSYLTGKGYTGVSIITKRHGTGPHWHVQWTGTPASDEWTVSQ